MNANFNFFNEVRRRLTSRGYKAHGEGIFTKGGNGSPADWLSVDGNSYLYTVNVGVVFPELSFKMRDAMPSQPGFAPLDGISPSLVPFVFSPVNRYLQLPIRGRNPSISSALSYTDAEELAQCLCELLPPRLSRFHDLEHAVSEVESTLESGSVKAFLLVLAYLKLGDEKAASSFARKAVEAFRSDSMRRVYNEFLRNIHVSHNLPVSFFSA